MGGEEGVLFVCLYQYGTCYLLFVLFNTSSMEDIVGLSVAVQAVTSKFYL